MQTRTVIVAGIISMATAAMFAQAPVPPAAGQTPAAPGGRAGGGGRGGPAIVSPQIEADGRVTFRISAPQAATVTVGGDINGSLVADPAASAPAPAPQAAPGAPPEGARGGGRGGPPAVAMARARTASGAARRSRAGQTWRLALQLHRGRRDGGRLAQRQRVAEPDPGAEPPRRAGRFLRDAGRAARASRPSATSLHARQRATRDVRLHPARYEKGTRRYPVLYLIHGGGDTARVVVHGRPREQHPRQPDRGEEGHADDRRDAVWVDAVGRPGDDADATKDPFNDEMLKDIIPFVEASYRTPARPTPGRCPGCRWAASRP